MIMAGAISVSGWFTESHSCPCLCLALRLKGYGELGLQKNSIGRRELRKLKAGGLSSSFLDAWSEGRLSARMLSQIAYGCSGKQQKFRKLSVVDELGGQSEDTFGDVKLQLLNYFTLKATRTVLVQLYEMNPPSYMWFHNFVATNNPADGKRFIQALVKEKRDLAERVMITRLHLYGKWIKVCNHGEMYKKISDENLTLMQERLMETVIWPSDDANTEKKD